MEKKQTAVEWLVNEINHGGLISKYRFDDIVKQAKEKEKQQITDAYISGQMRNERPSTYWKLIYEK